MSLGRHQITRDLKCVLCHIVCDKSIVSLLSMLRNLIAVTVNTSMSELYVHIGDPTHESDPHLSQKSRRAVHEIEAQLPLTTVEYIPFTISSNQTALGFSCMYGPATFLRKMRVTFVRWIVNVCVQRTAYSMYCTYSYVL